MLREEAPFSAALEREHAAWRQFAGAADAAPFWNAWLHLQCQALQAQSIDVAAGAVLWRQADGSYAPAGVWPSSRHDVGHLAKAARQALAERRGVCLPSESVTSSGAARACIAYPALVADNAIGVAVVDVRVDGEVQMQSAMRLLHWGAGWLENRARQQAAQADEARLAQTIAATELLAATAEQDSCDEAAITLVNELVRRIGAEQAALGFVRHSRVRLAAISQLAWFERRSQEAGAIENVLDEALDQGGVVAVPARAGHPYRVSVAHEERRQQAGWAALASVVLTGRSGPVAVLGAHWADAAPAAEIERGIALMEAAALLCGPVLEDKLDRQRWIAGRAPRALARLRGRLFGRGHGRLKLGVAAAALMIGFLAVATQEHRVTAKSAIEGEVQRAAVAPFRGYIAAAPVRAGDVVREGDTLAVLEDRDLVLERARWTSELDQATQKYHDAMARGDRPAAMMLAAQQRQARAQLELVEEKVLRSRIAAPVAGLVVSGDLSQMLGSPVEQGQTLFEVAPLDAYRVVLRVDERDITQLRAGQQGQLVLSGLTSEPLAFRVKTITALAEQQDGRNVFRVEAELEGAAPRLRPGMEGVGKVTVGERSVLWVWTHPFVDWLRLALWRWLP